MIQAWARAQTSNSIYQIFSLAFLKFGIYSFSTISEWEKSINIWEHKVADRCKKNIHIWLSYVCCQFLDVLFPKWIFNFRLKAVNNVDIGFYMVCRNRNPLLRQSFKSFTTIVKLVRKGGSCLKSLILSFMETKVSLAKLSRKYWLNSSRAEFKKASSYVVRLLKRGWD